MDLLGKMATYVRVVEAGSLTAAARQLRRSPAAVSRQLHLLESELGTPLVARTTRRMTVTPRGRAYYERCLHVLRAVEDAQQAGRETQLGGTIRVSAPVTFGLASVVPKLRTLAVAQPALHLDLRLEDRLTDLVLEGVDVAIRVASAPPLTTEVIAHRLCAWRRIAVASPAYLRRCGTPREPSQLASHAALSHAIDHAESWSFVRGEDLERVRVRISVRCASNAGHVLRDLALDGAGIAMLPAWFVREELADRRLRRVMPAWAGERTVAHALYRAQHRSEHRVRVLVEHLRAAYDADPLS